MLAKTSIAAILWPRPTAAGLYLVKIRITIDGEREYCNPRTTVEIAKPYWDQAGEKVKASHPDAQAHNLEILKVKSNIDQQLKTASLKDQQLTAKQLKALVETGACVDDFLAFSKSVLDEKRSKRQPRTMILHDRYLEDLKDFWKRDKLPMNEIDKQFLIDYEQYLRERFAPTTLANHWVIFMSWINKASGRGLLDTSSFFDYERPTGKPAEKDYLSLDEISLFTDFAEDVTNELLLRTGAAWLLLGCYTGLRVSDWSRFDFNRMVIDNEIRLRAKKNGSYVSIPIHDALEQVLLLIKDLSLSVYNTNGERSLVSSLHHAIQRVVKKIGLHKHITTHCGRKTFAVTICRGFGIPLEDCAQFMGITISTCLNSYYRITNDTLNKRAREKWNTMQQPPPKMVAA